ncbi:MAG: hypothetical protein AAF702_01350 [Chloroflexota bacterium]
MNIPIWRELNFTVTEDDTTMNFHRYAIVPLSKLFGKSLPTHNINATTESAPDVIRIAWLRRFSTTAEQVNSLLETFSDAGIDVWLVNSEHLPLEQILCFDLILLESSSNSPSRIQTQLSRIRSGSRAPLILLTDQYSVQWSIDMLQAGADAILPLSSSPEIILARCRSLLRRWLSKK